MQTIDRHQCQVPPDALERLRVGETLALSDDGSILAFIVPALAFGEQRPFGLCQGEFTVPENFNDPDPELEALFYGEVDELP